MQRTRSFIQLKAINQQYTSSALLNDRITDYIQNKPDTVTEEVKQNNVVVGNKQILSNKSRDIVVPLHQYTVEDICDTIQQWVCNDINYKKYLLKTKRIFKQHNLSGQKMYYLSAEDVKCIVKEELLVFMTSKTVNIIFQCFDQWKKENSECIASMSSDRIVNKLYKYPIERLIKKINDEQIDGTKMVNILDKDMNHIFKSQTGWNNEEIEQIRLLLSRKNSMTKKQFESNMQNVIWQHSVQKSISGNIESKIRNILLHDYKIDIVQINYEFKNNKNNKNTQLIIQKIMNMVQEIAENHNNHDNDLVKQLYNMIAACFVFTKKKYCPHSNSLSQAWTCNNCGNYNF
eukprot:56418_1